MELLKKKTRRIADKSKEKKDQFNKKVNKQKEIETKKEKKEIETKKEKKEKENKKEKKEKENKKEKKQKEKENKKEKKQKENKKEKKQKENKKEKKQKENKKEEKENNTISFEGYSKNKILDMADISEFNPLLDPPQINPDLTLFEIKKLAEEYFKQNRYNIEGLLEYDNTNKNILKKYLSCAINKLNIKYDLSIKNIIIEKIQKCGIILEKNEYENEIKKLKDESIKKNLEYIDYRLSIIDCLIFIKNNKYGNKNEARKKLKINKIFYFNHESTYGNNNYYFYGFAQELSGKIDEIYRYYQYYEYIIDKNLYFLKKDISKLTKKEEYIFKFVSNILLDKRAITRTQMYEEIKNYLEGKPIDDSKILEKIIKKRNNKKQKEKLKDYINYNLNFNDDYIEYIINEKNFIDRKPYSNTYIKKYKYNIFNKDIIKLINNVSLDNFEEQIFRKIIPEPETSDLFYKDTKKIIFGILKKILQSKAAENFFNKHYGDKHNKNNNNKIKYHFNKENVIEEIFNRIEFHPFFNPIKNAYTNAADLSIVVNLIPGRFNIYDEINYFNKQILQIGRIIVFLTHEIFGHFLRRYYSYLTNGGVKMNTKEDDNIDTKPEGGDFIERKFLGIKTHSKLYLKDTLFLFFYGENFETYPLVKKKMNITEEMLKMICIDNPEIFNFLNIDKEDEDDDKKEKGRKHENNDDEEEEEIDDDEEEYEKKEKEKKYENNDDEEEEDIDDDEEEYEKKDKEKKYENNDDEEEDIDDDEEEYEKKDKEKKHENNDDEGEEDKSDDDGEYDIVELKEENNEEQEEENMINQGNKFEEKDHEKGKISIEQYCNYLNPVNSPYHSIISCGFRKDEQFIELISDN